MMVYSPMPKQCPSTMLTNILAIMEAWELPASPPPPLELQGGANFKGGGGEGGRRVPLPTRTSISCGLNGPHTSQPVKCQRPWGGRVSCSRRCNSQPHSRIEYTWTTGPRPHSTRSAYRSLLGP